MLTFGWEVGLALSFVRPVDHQVPEAAETVGDLICEKEKKKPMGKRGSGVVFTASVVVPGDEPPFMHKQRPFLFLGATAAGPELNRNPGQAHSGCAGPKSFIIHPPSRAKTDTPWPRRDL